tara:strand:- start:1366 stop:1713 length:348 start_codon:yes stop_codon:yes gene_type:complete
MTEQARRETGREETKNREDSELCNPVMKCNCCGISTDALCILGYMMIQISANDTYDNIISFGEINWEFLKEGLVFGARDRVFEMFLPLFRITVPPRLYEIVSTKAGKEDEGCLRF